MSRLRRLRRRPQFQSLDRRAVMDADGIELELNHGSQVEAGEVAEVGDVADADATPAVDLSFETGVLIDESSPETAFAVDDENAEIFQTMMFSLSGDDESISSDDEPSDNAVVLDESGNAILAIRGGIAPNFRTLGDAEDSDVVDVSGETVDLGEIQTLGVLGSDESVDESGITPEDGILLEDGELDPSVLFQSTGAPSDTPDDLPIDDKIDGDLDPDVIFQTTGAPSDENLEEDGAIDGEVVITAAPTRDFDVNRDGTVTPLDALLVINSLSRQQRQAGRSAAMSMSALSTETNDNLDVNKDNRVTPSDALLVINQIARGHASVRKGIAVGEHNGSTESDLPADESTDELPSNDSRIAGYTTLTLAGLGGSPVVLNVNEQGEIEAISDGESLEVKVGDDDLVIVDGQATPVRVLRVGDATYIVPTSENSDDVTVAWPNAVDDVMAQWA
jgi:hypothetical protein